ncbi:hypothetical protein BH23GEM8_BH23GEM8_20260 [soil metagenome]
MNRRRRGVVTDPDHSDRRLQGSAHSLPYSVIWDAALALAHRMSRWVVVSADSGKGEIVAEATSRFAGFVDDVVIRVSLDDQGLTRVDLSSHSRVGRFDFGANRRRVQKYLRRLEKSIAAD